MLDSNANSKSIEGHASMSRDKVSLGLQRQLRSKVRGNIVVGRWCGRLLFNLEERSHGNSAAIKALEVPDVSGMLEVIEMLRLKEGEASGCQPIERYVEGTEQRLVSIAEVLERARAREKVRRLDVQTRRWNVVDGRHVGCKNVGDENTSTTETTSSHHHIATSFPPIISHSL